MMMGEVKGEFPREGGSSVSSGTSTPWGRLAVLWLEEIRAADEVEEDIAID